MDPSVWGKDLWRSLHRITYAYPDNPSSEDQQNANIFFSTIGNLLPCEKCRLNYKKHLKKYPINDNVLANRDSLMNWLIDIHNETNKILGKPVINREQAKRLIEETESHSQILTIFIIFIVIIILVIILWYKQTYFMS